MSVYSAHLCRSNFYLLRPRRVTWMEGVYVKSERFGTLNLGMLSLA